MEAYYQGLAQLLPEYERLEISYDQELEMISITTDDVMIYSDTAAKIYAYCSKHGLRCWIGYSYAGQKLKLGILKGV